MVKTALKVFLLLVMVACNSPRYSTNSIDSKLHISLNEDQVIHENESIQFRIQNSSAERLTLIYPEKLRIEKNENGEWRNLKILDCPCDAPCQPKPEKLLLESGKNLILNWDQRESWCGSRSTSQIRETIYKEAGSGKYRISIHLKKEDGEESTFYKHFNIGI
jgi:hypothetical protein